MEKQVISIKVKANSKKQKFEKISDGVYRAVLKSKPVNGRANEELLGLLKKEFGVEGKIIKGKSSRKKIVRLNGD